MDRTSRRAAPALAIVIICICGAAAGPGFDLDVVAAQARSLGRAFLTWYNQTPAVDRMTWGGIVAASMLGLGVSLERLKRLRRKTILPDEFTNRFLERLKDGRLDRGKALDFCELNPSPASRVALAAVKRWGRPVADLERAVSLASGRGGQTSEKRGYASSPRRARATSRSPRHPLRDRPDTLGTRIDGWTRNLGSGDCLGTGPLTAGVAVAVLALVAFDGLMVKIESLVGALDLAGRDDRRRGYVDPKRTPFARAGVIRACSYSASEAG